MCTSVIAINHSFHLLPSVTATHLCHHHCYLPLPSITATHHCHPSLPPITAIHHCHPSLPPITAIHHCHPSLLSITAIYHCHLYSTRISRRRLQNTPRYLQRIRRRQNPYIQYPVHHEGSPHLTASPPLSVLSDGSDGDDLPLRLSPSPEQDLGSYVPLPFNNSQLDSFTRSLSPIAMQEIRQLADKGKSPPPSARPPSMAGTCKGAPQKRRRPIGQSSTTVYGDSSSSDNDNDSDSDASDDVLLQT